METQGAPTDWTQYFQQQEVFHIKCQLEDTTLKPAKRWLEEIPDLAASFLKQWKIVCSQLATTDKSMRALFHCFGGINRSAGVLCAWLVVAYDYFAREAVQSLLQKEPLCVLGAIGHVLEALWDLEGLRTKWQRDFSAACRG